MTPESAVGHQFGISTSTLQRWKYKEKYWPAGRAVMRPLAEFVDLARPLRGRGGYTADVAMLILAGEHRVPTVGLADTLIGLLCIPEGAEDPAAGLDAYQLISEVRKTEAGRRSFDLYADLLSDDLDSGQAPIDLMEDRADNAQTAVALALQGETVDDEMVDDLAQLLENAAARLLNLEPEIASDATMGSVRFDLAMIQHEIQQMEDWLTKASLDEMADAVAVAARLDEAMRIVMGERGVQGEAERWRGIGRIAVRIGANPKDAMEGLRTLSALRHQGLIEGLHPDGKIEEPEH